MDRGMLGRALMVGSWLATAACGQAGSNAADAAFDAVIEPPDGGVPDTGPSPEACASEGAMRTQPCGNCGLQSETCVGGFWEPQSACLGQGECSPGSADIQAMPMCAEQQRLCDAECHWTAWSQTVAPGECEIADTRLVAEACPPGMYRWQSCSEACTWVTDGDTCVDACGGAARTTPVDAEEICIPGGPFIRGAEPLLTWEYSTPVAEVSLSAFYIDRYPVTYRRYRECYEEGVCPLASPYAAGRLYDPIWDNRPISDVTWDEAGAFCGWDGRRLVTEAEWEKAARGPAPSEAWYPWGGTEFRCDLFYAPPCGYMHDPYDPFADPVDAFPGTASVYGVEQLIGGGRQWVHDFFDPDYYSDPESLINPKGPATGVDHAARGMFRPYATTYDRVTVRTWIGESIRCGRDAALGL